ncbi:hypothetical protein TBLA_0B02670 [Henningerozyma blattae CBS 6284]|uniref:RING-type domain-containing protein n=1 Tax=Henningerozyma blattae (strain ATCC 34711 / CBS 6284 / DSM 70876 / NBRC 10599 / NRRL Y-10934 / UCD 77-7) TaxID=1071380 RepID=I2GYA7_HENB6|nr:hypothetical protein TBLA_0B02670 [Tetrapisispora blattae CBS 6284]CCH59109.1 hypothetical protein TBLA_0B02670 [Tetrapisispora blattae CBS 6284]
MSGLLHTSLIQRSKKTKNKLLIQILDSTVCSICQDYMFVPMVTPCGHSFCYGCLCSWFSSSNVDGLSCPHCRTSITSAPYFNSTLKQWLEIFLDTLDDNDKIKDIFKSMTEGKEESFKKYQKDKNNDQLYNGVFSETALAVIDEDDDGIARCSNCHWELDPDFEEGGNVCPHCNTRIRNHVTSTSTNVRTEGFQSSEYSEDELEQLQDDITRQREPSEDSNNNINNGNADNEESPNRKSITNIFDDKASEDDEYYSSEIDAPSTTKFRPKTNKFGWKANIYKQRTTSYNDEAGINDELDMDSDLADFIADDDEIEVEELDDNEDEIDGIRIKHRTPSNDGYEVTDGFSDDDDDNQETLGPLSNKEDMLNESESHDSEYYERNHSGFVSGDSLDDSAEVQELMKRRSRKRIIEDDEDDEVEEIGSKKIASKTTTKSDDNQDLEKSDSDIMDLLDGNQTSNNSSKRQRRYKVVVPDSDED